MSFISTYKYRRVIGVGMLVAVLVMCGVAFYTNVVHAQISSGTTQLYDPLDSTGDNPLEELLQRIISYLTMIAAPIITVMVLWGGIQILIAQDNVTKYKKGLDTVKHAAIGAAIVILADGILLVVKGFLTV